MANIKLIRLGAKDNLSTWAEKTNSIINVVEDFLQNSGSIITQGSPTTSQMIVWDAADSKYTNKTLTGPITIASYDTTTFQFGAQPSFITELTEKAVATGSDYVMIYDSASSTLKKAAISSIQTSQAAAGSDTQVQYNSSGTFGASAGLTFNYSTNTLTVGNGLVVDTNKLFVGTNVGIGTNTPSYPLDVIGSVNISSGNTYRINGTTVISSNSLGSGIVSSSLQSVGTLSSLTVSGTTNLQGATTVSNTLIANSFSSSGTVTGNILQATTSLTAPTITSTSVSASSNVSVANRASIYGDYSEYYSNSGNNDDDGSYMIIFYRNISTGVVSGKFLGKFVFSGKDSSGSSYQVGSSINSVAEGTFTTTSSPASIRFYTTPSGTVTPIERMRIFPSGSITIGASPNTERSLLYVQGQVHAGDTSVSSASVAINTNGTGSRSSSITFHSDTTYNPSFSIVRAADGSNATTTFTHRGTGNVIFTNQEAASFVFNIAGSSKLTISPTALTFDVAISGSSGGRLGNTLIESNYLEISNYGSGDRDSYIDFHSESASYTDYNLRIIRNLGANGDGKIINRGSGYFDILCQDAGSNFRIYTANTLRMLISNTGVTYVYGELQIV